MPPRRGRRAARRAPLRGPRTSSLRFFEARHRDGSRSRCAAHRQSGTSCAVLLGHARARRVPRRGGRRLHDDAVQVHEQVLLLVRARVDAALEATPKRGTPSRTRRRPLRSRARGRRIGGWRRRGARRNAEIICPRPSLETVRTPAAGVVIPYKYATRPPVSYLFRKNCRYGGGHSKHQRLTATIAAQSATKRTRHIGI